MLRPAYSYIVWFFMLWSSLAQAQPNATPILNLGPLYDCSQPQKLGIFDYPSLKNCFHSMQKQEVLVLTFCGKVFRYPPVATTFPTCYCTLETITMTHQYSNIFTRKQQYHNIQSVLMLG